MSYRNPFAVTYGPACTDEHRSAIANALGIRMMLVEHRGHQTYGRHDATWPGAWKGEDWPALCDAFEEMGIPNAPGTVVFAVAGEAPEDRGVWVYPDDSHLRTIHARNAALDNG